MWIKTLIVRCRYEGTWCHGDFVSFNRRSGGYVVYGRSDATLNPGGVRIGTAEIYRQVEQLDWVLESIAVGQDMPDGDTRIVLFVVTKHSGADRTTDVPQQQLDAEQVAEIKAQIRVNTTPRHVPAVVLSVADIPRTKSGKITGKSGNMLLHSTAY